MKDEEESSKRNAEEMIEKLKQESKDKVNILRLRPSLLTRCKWPEIAPLVKVNTCFMACGWV